MKIWEKRNQNVNFPNLFLSHHIPLIIVLLKFFFFFLVFPFKGCCIYKKPLEFGESSSEEDDDECEHCFGHVEKKKKNQKKHDNGNSHDDCNGHQPNEPQSSS